MLGEEDKGLGRKWVEHIINTPTDGKYQDKPDQCFYIIYMYLLKRQNKDYLK